MEVGRVNKTLYLLNYIDDEEYRRRILTQQPGRSRHAVAGGRSVYQRGEIKNVTVRGGRINWVRWGLSLTQLYCGTYALYAGSAITFAQRW